MNTTRHQGRDHSQLFLVRLWAEETRGSGDGSEGSEGQIDWCGKLQHVVSGEARYFCGCPQLTDTLLQMMQEHQKHRKG